MNTRQRKTDFFKKLPQFFFFAAYWMKSNAAGARFKHPLLCSFKITGKCNLKCSHCPFWREKNASELDFEKVCNILNELYKNGIRIVIFEGGEPLLWKDENAQKNISDVIDYAKGLFFYVGLTTNGTHDLKKIPDKTDIIFISIDGMQKTHDSIRGKSFDKIINNIKNCGHGKKIIVNICVSKTNGSQVGQLVKFLNDIVYGITIQFFYPYNTVDDVMLSPCEKKLVLGELAALKKSGFKVLDSEACLKSMAYNTWKCADFLVCNVDKYGETSYGCYLKNKVGKTDCAHCGFSVHCEISMAYRLNLSALKSAAYIFWG